MLCKGFTSRPINSNGHIDMGLNFVSSEKLEQPGFESINLRMRQDLVAVKSLSQGDEPNQDTAKSDWAGLKKLHLLIVRRPSFLDPDFNILSEL